MLVNARSMWRGSRRSIGTVRSSSSRTACCTELGLMRLRTHLAAMLSAASITEYPGAIVVSVPSSTISARKNVLHSAGIVMP